VERALDANAPRYPVPWSSPTRARQRALRPDFWPYGLEPNRPTIEGFLDYAFEQGVTARQLSPEELFVPAVLETFRI
jgi:4,5-dihydroxyphthalate decarboxylase